MPTTSDLKLFRSLIRDGKKYVLSSRNCGFGDNLFALAHAWLYCRKAGRDLIVDFCQSRYLREPTINAGCLFFELPEEFEGVRILNFPEITWRLRRLMHLRSWAAWLHSRFPRTAAYLEKLTELAPSVLPQFGKSIDLGEEKERHLVATGEVVEPQFIRFVGCHCDHLPEIRQFLAAVRPLKKIQADIDTFLARVPERFIGLHVRFYSEKWVPFPRYGDYWTEFGQSIARIIGMVEKARSSGWSDCPVLLCTNDLTVQKTLMEKIDGIICYGTEFGDSAEKEIFDQGLSSAGHDAIVEMFSLAKANLLIRFPPSNSWFSEIAAVKVPYLLQEHDNEFLIKDQLNLGENFSELAAHN
jgi:hypothetical protein